MAIGLQSGALQTCGLALHILLTTPLDWGMPFSIPHRLQSHAVI